MDSPAPASSPFSNHKTFVNIPTLAANQRHPAMAKQHQMDLSSSDTRLVADKEMNSTPPPPQQNVIECKPVSVGPIGVRRVYYYIIGTIVVLSLVITGLVLLSKRPGGEFSVGGAKMMASSSNNNHHYLFPADKDDDDEHHEHSVSDHGSEEEPNVISGAGKLPLGPRSRTRQQQLNYKEVPAEKQVCMSPGCVRAAAQILNNMDNHTEPCEDFYKFACGRWIETQLIPDEKTSLSVFSQSAADLNIKLRALIERRPTGADPPIVGQMRNLYASCMNLTDIEVRGDGPLLEMLREFGGWPVVSARTRINRQTMASTQTTTIPSTIVTTTTGSRNSTPNGNNFNWLDTIIKFRQQGFSHDMIVDLSVVPDVRNSRRYIIELDQSSLGLPDRSYYFKGLNDSTVSAYLSLMVESAVMLGAERHEARRQMMEALEFESSLARIAVPREQRRNATRLYNKMPARALYSLAPNIDWRRYLEALLRDDELDLDNDKVIVKVPSFIKALDSLLVNTEPRIIANYMMWRIVRHSMSALSRKWRELAHSYSMITTGRQAEEPRWEQCLGSLEGTLGTALSALYVKNHFNGRSKAAALEMVEYIRDEFLHILDEIDWMDESTREEAKVKAKSIAPFIGYPDELLEDELIEELYKGISMARTNFYQNVRNLRIWSTNYAFSQLRKPNKRGDWKKHARAAVVNAYYNSLENSIEFPAGILQGAFFDAERPNYMNFGAIGFVIGHEITHGFDDRGRQFDKDGNNRNWWNSETDQKFKERAQCIVDQYSNYTVPDTDLKVNGINTQGENIADNGGLKEAFRAYNEWVKRNGVEQLLPGIRLNQKQLFWVSAANVWCGKYRPEVLKMRVIAGSHSPAQFRITGPLSNLKEFSETFNCPVGATLNPIKKCSVW